MSQAWIKLRCVTQINGLRYGIGDVVQVRDTVARSLVLQRKATHHDPNPKQAASAPAGDAGVVAGGGGEQAVGVEAGDAGLHAADGDVPDDSVIGPGELPEGGPMEVEAFAQLAADDFEEARDYARPLGVTARGREELVARYEARINEWLAGEENAGVDDGQVQR